MRNFFRNRRIGIADRRTLARFLARAPVLCLCILSASCLRHRESVRVPDLDLVLKWIPPGEGYIGSARPEREWAEGPEGMGPTNWFGDEGGDPSPVRFRRGFWLGATEVTVGQWRRFMEETGYRTQAEEKGAAWCYDWRKGQFGYLPGTTWAHPNFPFPLRDDHPVTVVSWYDAEAFCAWLTDRERAAGRLPKGYAYRLPTEAEWEYACRAGAEGIFWWGDSLADGKGRFNISSLDADAHGPWDFACPWKDGFKFISPVDHYGARGRNRFGLADMLGNVWEWCLDDYTPRGPQPDVHRAGGKRKIIRGGAFDDRPAYARCAVRAAPAPDDPNFARGFRVCLGPAQRPAAP